MKKERMTGMRLAGIVLIGIVLLLDIAFFVGKDREFSPTENRNLTTLPAFSVDAAASGRFEASFDDYVADQFPFRDGWIRIKALADRLMGHNEANGVFLGSDGYLIQNFTMPDYDTYRAQADAIRDFSIRHSDMKQYMLVAPSALTVMADKLPAFAQAGDESGYIDKLKLDTSDLTMQFIDVRDTLQQLKATEQVFYRTDHHWTTAAAYAAYRELARAAGLNGINMMYDRLLVTDSFSGTLGSMSGFRTGEQDSIEVFVPKAQTVDYVVTYVYEGKRSASFYDADKLKEKDKYAMFFSGNHPTIRIDTNADSKRVLLVFKDSYANCLIPFLVGDYKKIVVVDPRYFTDDIEELIEVEGINEILFLYNANTLAADKTLIQDIGR